MEGIIKWVQPPRRPIWAAYLLAVAMSATMIGLRVSLDPWLGGHSVLTAFLLPVVLSAYVGGLGPGLLATVLAALGTEYFVLQPVHSMDIASTGNLLAWIAMIVCGVVISVSLDALRRARQPDPNPPVVDTAAMELKVRIGFAVALAVFCAVGALSYYSSQQRSENAAVRQRAELSIEAMQAVTAALRDLETGAGRFVITGAENQLESYRETVASVDAQLEAVRQYALGDPAQARRFETLSQLVARRKAVADEVIELRRHGFEPARAAIASGEGKRLLNAVRISIDEMAHAERNTVRERQARIERYALMTRVSILLGGALTFAFVFATQFVVGRDFAGRRRADAALADANRLLEARVKERAESQDALEEGSRRMKWANHFLDSVVEYIPHMIFVKDAVDRRVLRINRAGEELLGYSRKELLGRNDRDIFPKLEAEDREQLLSGTMMDTLEERIQTRFKGERILHTKRIPILDEKHQVRYVLGFSEDITEQEEKKAEILRLNEALQQRAAEADSASRAKTTFLATMSHEIRTPMNGMLGSLELLSLTILDADQRATLEIVRESSRSLLRIIDDILDFSKMEAGKLEVRPEACSIKKLIEEVHSIYGGNASSTGVVVKRQVDPRISPLVRVDSLRLRQVLNNFVSNALKFTEQGSIEIGAEWIERVDGADRVCFSVKDTGIGISAGDQQRLFEPFTQGTGDASRRPGGTGLGLTICRRLSELMGGTIEMSSELGKGTTMSLRLTLPIADPDELKADVLGARDRPTSTRRRTAPSISQAEEDGTLVLLVDDHPTNRALIARQVQTLGYAAETAANGVEALDLWRSGRFGLVLTDCHMPEMDGYELARSIRKIEAGKGGRRTPIIACTANAFAGEVAICLAAGMDDCLVKPVELSALLNKLNQWLPISAQPASPPINLSLIAASWGSERSKLDAVLAEFRLANEHDADNLRQGVAANDIVQVTRAAHRMLGAGKMVGAEDLAVVCERLDRAGQANDWKTIMDSLPAFEHECTRLNAYLESRASQPPEQ